MSSINNSKSSKKSDKKQAPLKGADAMENTTDNQVTISVSEVECFLSQLNAQESLIQSLLEANRNLNLELEMLIQKAGLSENFQAPKEASNTSEIVSLKPVNIDPIPNVKKGDCLLYTS